MPKPKILFRCLIGLIGFLQCHSTRAESLHGKILDRASFDESQSGKPVAGARLSLYDAKGKRVAVKSTARTGAYRFPKVSQGTYTLAIDKKDYLPSPLYR